MTILSEALYVGSVGAVVNVIVSLLVPLIFTPTAIQIKPPNGAAALSAFDQFMHMIVHHKQVLPMSSFIVFILVTLTMIVASTTGSQSL